MFEKEITYEYNYNSIIEDADELYDYDDYEYYKYSPDTIEYDNYYHYITKEISEE